eukprot:6616520-Pyramimonas_sp.AAC.1
MEPGGSSSRPSALRRPRARGRGHPVRARARSSALARANQADGAAATDTATGGSAASALRQRGGFRAGPRNQRSHPEHLMLELCRGEHNNIGSPNNFCNASCKATRHTEKGDMTTDTGRDQVLRGIRTFKGKQISHWASIPWAGGCPRHRVNESVYYRKGGHIFLRRLRGVPKRSGKAGGAAHEEPGQKLIAPNGHLIACGDESGGAHRVDVRYRRCRWSWVSLEMVN